jgi:general secretion pathway protein A
MTPAYLGHFALERAPSPRRYPTSICGCRLPRRPWSTSCAKPSMSVLPSSSPAIPALARPASCVALRHRLPQTGFRLTYCHNATLGRRDFYRQLCLALGLAPSAAAAALFFAVSSHVEDLGRERVHPVFLLDEAHLLHQDMLDHLHILLNYQWDSRALLSLVLVGLPELSDRLVLRRNRSLYSRIYTRLNLTPLTPDDTADYIRSRLKQSGCDRELVTADALAMLHEAAAGSLRDLDRLATAALRDAARRKRKLVERDAITRVVDTEPREAA